MDLTELKNILQMLDQERIIEFELEADGMKLRIKKGSAEVEPAQAAPRPVTAPVAAPTDAPAAPAAETGLHVVKSPIVGTFYRSPDPNSPPFAKIGDQVKPGQVLCIIEAMKLMNEIEAEVAGEIVQIHHETGQPVQYGDPLFSVRLKA